MSNKINTKINISIISSLGILAILALGTFALAPEKAKASHNDGPEISIDGYGYSKERKFPTRTNQRDDGTSIAVGGYGYNKARTFPTSNIQEDDGTSIAISGYGYDTARAGNSNNANRATDSNPTPVIYSISPDTLESGTNKTMISITGDNFIPSSIVKWNSSDRETIYINSTSLAVKLTGDDLKEMGEYLITVWNRAPGGGYSNAVVFTIGVAGINSANGIDSNLAGSAIIGAQGSTFGLIAWLLFAILILIVVILWRKVYVTDKQKNAPLKHA